MRATVRVPPSPSETTRLESSKPHPTTKFEEISPTDVPISSSTEKNDLCIGFLFFLSLGFLLSGNDYD